MHTALERLQRNDVRYRIVLDLSDLDHRPTVDTDERSATSAICSRRGVRALAHRVLTGVEVVLSEGHGARVVAGHDPLGHGDAIDDGPLLTLIIEANLVAMEDAYGLHFMGRTPLATEGIYRMIAVNAEVMTGAGWTTSGNDDCLNRVG